MLEKVSNLSGKTFLMLYNIGTLDEHMHLLLPALIRLFKVDASVDIRRAAIKTLTRLIPRVQVGNFVQFKDHLTAKLKIVNFTYLLFKFPLVDIFCCYVYFFCQVTGHISSLVHHLKLVLDGLVSTS